MKMKKFFKILSYIVIICLLLVVITKIAFSNSEKSGIKYGYVDKTGKMVIKPQFDKAGDFHEGLAYACNSKCGYINKIGKFVISPQFDTAENFSEGLAALEINKKWGYIDKTGKFVIKPVFNYGYEFKEGLAYVNSLSVTTIKNEYINKAGKIIIKESNYKITPSIFIDNMSLIEINNKYGFINRTGKIIIPAVFDNTKLFNEGLAPVKQDNKYGSTLNIKIKNPNDKIVLVKQNNKWISIDKTVLSRQNSKWGFIDKNGNYVIEPRFETVDNFNEGLAPVKTNGEYGIAKWGFINKGGYPVIDPEFEDAGKFNEGLAPVMLNNKVGFINKKGEIVIKPQFGKRRFPNDCLFHEGMARVNINDKIGFVNKQGILIVKPVYIDVEDFSEGLAKVGVRK